MIKQFKQLIQFFTARLTSANDLVQTPYSQAQLEIISQAQTLLDAKIYDQYFLLVKNGYIIPPEQQKQLSNLFTSDITHYVQGGLSSYLSYDDKNEHLPKAFFNKLLDYGYQPNEEDIVCILMDEFYHIYNRNCLFVEGDKLNALKEKYKGVELEEQIEKNLRNSSPFFKKLNDTIKDKLSDAQFTEKLFISWQNHLLSHLDNFEDSPVKNFKLAFELMGNTWLAHGNLKIDTLETLNFNLDNRLKKLKKNNKIVTYFDEEDYKKVSNTVKEIQATLTFFINLINQPDFNQLLDKTRQAYSQGTIEIKKENINQYNENIKSLPTLTYEKINAIKDSCFELEKHKESLDLEQNVALKNIIEKSLPAILEQYFNVPTQFRDKVLKDDKTPLDYVNNSLDNLIDYLSNFHQTVAESYIQQLAVSEKYTKKLSLNH